MKNIFINSSASDIGRQAHPYVLWTDTGVTLSNIDKQGISGNTFYYKVVISDGTESDWYGPINISQTLDLTVDIDKSFDNTISRLITISKTLSLSKTINSIPNTNIILNNLLDISYSKQLQNVSNSNIITILNIVKNLSVGSIDTAFTMFESLELSNLFITYIDNKSVFINTSPVDEGRRTHQYVAWSDTSIELGSISKQGFEAYIYYYKVSNNGETDWYGPIVINEVHNAILQLISDFDIISLIVQMGTIEAEINLNKNYNINNYTIAVLKGFIELAHHLQHYILAYDLSSINAFISLTKGLTLNIETQALLNALVVMLQNNSITITQLNAVLNATMQLAPSYATLTSAPEPPVFWEVRTFKIIIGE